MPEERNIPISALHREFTVKVNDREVERSEQLLGVYIQKSANRISSAKLIYLDGAASSSDFPLSNSPDFIPGSTIEVLAGSGHDLVTLFKGIIISQSLKVREKTAPQMIVECRHKAIALTVGRKNAYYYDQTDASIIETIFGNAGVDCSVESTAVTHSQLVQYYCTDWDFIVMRAEANGKIVFTNGEQVEIKAAILGSRPVCTLLFGSTILEMDSEIESRSQYAGVKSVSWDAARQSVVEKDAADPQIAGAGNLSISDLSSTIDLDHLRLQQTSTPDTESQAWADAYRMKSQLSKTNGRLKCEGISTVNPGDMVTLSGVGERFNGDVFVTGVRHDFDLVQGWKTHIQFGNTNAWFGDEHKIEASKAGSLVASINGLQIGVVVSNEDPDGEYRVRVKMPLIDNNQDGTWARLATLDAGASRGTFFRPEVGDEVVLGFMDDDPRYPVILGMLHSSANAAPLEGSDDNHEKVYQSRSEMKLYFNDDTKIIRLETPAGNKITLSEDDSSVKIEDQNSNTIEMTSDGIKIQSSMALELKAATEIKIEAGTSLEISGTSSLKLEGSGSVEISSSGSTTIKGSTLMLN
jgi:Rhs element Vgr protein